MACISSSHGHNAVRYTMEKDKKNKDHKVEILRDHGLDDCIFAPTASDVWAAMKMDISNSKHRVQDALFRIEICPAAEECEGWKTEDWQQCLDDAIRHLNSTTIKGKDGKVLARPTELDRCKWVAALHKDTDNLHIHLVACRITDDDRVQDSYRCETRALKAADAMARERGWLRAQDRHNIRKERIHTDAIAVLHSMRQFSPEIYIQEMRARGWIIRAQRDSSGQLRGYSIGEETTHNGTRTGEIMYKSSQLGHSRDLMISQLHHTWMQLHEQDKKEELMNRPVWEPQARPQPEQPQPERTVSIQYNGNTIRIRETISDIIEDNITLPAIEDYYGEREDPVMPVMEEVMATAAALFVGMMVPVTPSAGGGGGGGSSSDLPWGRDPDEDDRAWARRCARKASQMHTPAHTARRGRHR